jgi:NAD(P)H dehydrogenase (quinone)
MSSIWPLAAIRRAPQHRSMKVLWIFAHPEQRSLNASLMREGLRELRDQGHGTKVSDLYAMGWKAVLDADDVRTAGHGTPPGRLTVGAEQEHAYTTGGLTEDVREEQRKIAWADTLVLHFPMWWFGPPAILKGWFDRVLVQGFAFGLRGADGRVLRYGEGGLSGRRALVVTSVGARESGFGPRGIHGHVDDVLWPLLHGTFWYTGMAPHRPFVVYGADRLTRAGHEQYARALRERLRTLPDAEPLPFRTENGGDYDDALTLRPWIEPGADGLAVHRIRATSPDASPEISPEISPEAPADGSADGSAELFACAGGAPGDGPRR